MAETAAARRRRGGGGGRQWMGVAETCQTASAFQHIANAANRLNQLGTAWLILNLLAQVANVHLDNIGLTHEVVAPHAVENGLAVEHLARVGKEEVEQVILGGGE